MTAAALAAVALFPIAARAADSEPAARTRVVVLPLQSFALAAAELEAVSRALDEAFRGDARIEVVDAAPILAEAASGEWLRADKLLYDGIQDYQNLELVRAVEQLGESVDLMERTFRDFGGGEGRRRMRDAYLHVGLARLEQGEAHEAEEWFAKAARVDPAFQPDPRAYPPAARATFAAAKKERLGEAYEAGRERLRELGKLVGVDVVVSGGVRHEPSDPEGWFLEVAWVDRWSGRSAVEIAEAAGRADLVRTVRGAAPKLIAAVRQEPWPAAVAGVRTRRRLLVGGAGAWLPDARIEKGAGGGQVYRWSDTVRYTGLHLALSPWERGPWAVVTDLSVFLPQPMADGGWSTPFEARGEFQGAGSLGARAVRTVRRDGWGLAGGVGLAFHESIASFRSEQTETGVVLFWLTPVATVSASRTLFARGGVETFVEVELAAGWDALGSGPSDWTLRSVAAGGVSF